MVLRGVIASLAVCFALGLAVSGCGGDDEAGTTLTKAEFIRQGDRICNEADEAFKTGFEEYSRQNRDQASEVVAVSVITEVGVPVLQEVADRLGGLEPPETDGPRVDAMMSDIEKAITITAKNPKAIASGQLDPFASFDKQAAAYGFKQCSQL